MCGLGVSEQLAAVPEFQGLGPLFKSSPEPVALTESETEYVIRCTKHTFPEHMVFQVSRGEALPQGPGTPHRCLEPSPMPDPRPAAVSLESLMQGLCGSRVSMCRHGAWDGGLGWASAWPWGERQDLLAAPGQQAWVQGSVSALTPAPLPGPV